MEPPDSERERLRLLELYSGMSDERLAELVEDWESLTEPARISLRQALESRGMSIEFESESEPAALPEDSEWTTVGEFGDPSSAGLARGLLESVGIRCALTDLQNSPLDGSSLPFGPIRLRVPGEEADSAVRLLEAPALEDPEAEGGP